MATFSLKYPNREHLRVYIIEQYGAFIVLPINKLGT